jgi:hypothetical protein
MNWLKVIILLTLAAVVSGCSSRFYQEAPALAAEEISIETFSLRGMQADYIVDVPVAEIFRFSQEMKNYMHMFPHAQLNLDEGALPIFEKPGDRFHVIWFNRLAGSVVLSKIIPAKELQWFLVADVWARVHFFFIPQGESTRVRVRLVFEDPGVLGLDLINRIQVWYVLYRTGMIARAAAKELNTEVRKDVKTKSSFTVICNLHRSTTMINASPEKVWDKITRIDFLNRALEDIASLESDSARLNRQGESARIVAEGLFGEHFIQAIVMDISPEKEAHLCLFIDEINAGAIFRLKPRSNATMVESIFYYEIPSDYLMSSEQMLMLSDVDAKLKAFLENLEVN